MDSSILVVKQCQACCRLGDRCTLVADRKKEAPLRPSWVVTDPELGPELHHACVGASILRLVITHVLHHQGLRRHVVFSLSIPLLCQ